MSKDAWDFDAGSTGTKTDGSKKDFMKLPVGVTLIRVLDNDPYVRWSHWMTQFHRSVTCPGNCAICKIRKLEKAEGIAKPRYSLQRKFSMNVYNHGTDRIEIMDEGVDFMAEMRIVREDLIAQQKNLSDAVLKVRKTIVSDKPKYRVDIDNVSTYSDKELQAIENKTNFAEYFKTATHEQIKALLAVTENHKEKFVEIMSGEEAETQNAEGEEIIETE